jgi:hypothetical protein
MRPLLSRSFILLVLLVATAARAAIVDLILERIRKGEFVFGRLDNNNPFPPVAWVGFHSYDDSKLTTANGELHFQEIGVTQALVAPVWIGRIDMILLGEYFSWQQVDFSYPRPQQINITTVMPVAAWLHQAGAHDQFAAFVTPEYVDSGGYENHKLVKSGGYAGAIGIHWSNDHLAWFYGGVGLFASGDDVFLPYFGFLWQPTREWSVSMILPWPTVSYAPTPDYMFQVGLMPAEAALANGQNASDLRISYDSWNLQFSAHRRLTSAFWISVAAGWSGFGSFSVNSNGNSQVNNDLKRSLVWTVQVSFRPSTNPRVPREAP